MLLWVGLALTVSYSHALPPPSTTRTLVDEASYLEVSAIVDREETEGIKCEDTPGWKNPTGKSCKDYATNGWCQDKGVPMGKEWTVGHKQGFPEQNCCVCGKDTKTVYDEFGCSDTLFWSNGEKGLGPAGTGLTCREYVSNGWCKGGWLTNQKKGGFPFK